MINTYSPWMELAALPHIDLVWTDLVGRLGEYDHQRQRISLDRRMRRHQARSVLAHELAHVRAADSVTVCERVNLRQEQRADREAARLLIDVRDLGNSIAVHGEHLSSLAVDLRVSVHMIRTRFACLHPSEWHYLRARLAEVN